MGPNNVITLQIVQELSIHVIYLYERHLQRERKRTQHTNPWGNGDYSIRRVASFHMSGSSRFVKARAEPRAQCDGKRWRLLSLASLNKAAPGELRGRPKREAGWGSSRYLRQANRPFLPRG